MDSKTSLNQIDNYKSTNKKNKNYDTKFKPIYRTRKWDNK